MLDLSGSAKLSQTINLPEESPSEDNNTGGYIRFDMHVHSQYSSDSITPVRSIVRSRERYGVLPLVCDHNTIAGSLKVYHEIHVNDPDLPRILAEEILTSDGEIIGVFLQEEIPAFLDSDETIDHIYDQGALAIVPHPFCSYRTSVIRHDVLDQIIHRVDIIEGYNGRAVDIRDNDLACRYAISSQLPISAGSDAHIPEELGRTYVTMKPFSSPEELVREIRHAAVHYRRALPPPHSPKRILPRSPERKAII